METPQSVGHASGDIGSNLSLDSLLERLQQLQQSNAIGMEKLQTAINVLSPNEDAHSTATSGNKQASGRHGEDAYAKVGAGLTVGTTIQHNAEAATRGGTRSSMDEV